MLSFIVRRLLYMPIMFVLLSLVAFLAMYAAPGDPFTICEFQFAANPDYCNLLRVKYGLARMKEYPAGSTVAEGDWDVGKRIDKRYEDVDGDARVSPGDRRVEKVRAFRPTPPWVQYGTWLWGVITRGDFGYSAQWSIDALTALFGQGRLANTLLLVFLTSLFSWLLAIPIGVYSAVRRYSLGDYAFTFFGFLGLSIPNFFLALVLIWFLVTFLNVGQYNLGVSADFFFHPGNCGGSIWGTYKDRSCFVIFLWVLWPTLLVIGTANMALLIRYMRGNLLDVLGMPYIQTARAKGLKERVVIWKHALRNAINPLISIMGFWIPSMFEGTLVAAIILNWPIVERIYWKALQEQDEYVIMTGLLFFGGSLLIGNLIADLLLAWSDPRIRYD